MPKNKNSKTKKARAATTKGPTSLPYYVTLMQVFNSMYEDYHAKKLDEPNVLMVSGIAQLNSIHIDDPHSNGIPAIFCILLQNTFHLSHFRFLTALKTWGLNLNFEPAVNVLILSHALKSRQPEYIRWVLTECGIKIPTSGNPMRDNDFKFDLEETKFLDYIEQNLGSTDVDMYLDLIPKYHAEGNTILHLAAIHNRTELFHKLVMAGANLNQPNFTGVTPAMLGVSYEDSKIIELLLSQEYGENIDLSLKSTEKDSLFHYIILGKNAQMLEFAVTQLERQRVSFSELTMRDGFNIVHWAIENAQCALVPNLLSLIDINAPTPDNNHLIVYAFINDEPDIGYHIARNYNIELEKATFSADDKNILQIVIEHDALISFIWLMDEGGFDIKSPDNEGRPPLLLASKVESVLIIDELFDSYNLEALQVRFADESGKCFVHYLVKHNLFINIEILLECDMLDFEHKDSDGNTILDIALIHGESHARIRDLCLDYIEKDAQRKRRKLKLKLSEIEQLHLLLPIYFADEVGGRAATIDGQTPVHLAYQAFGGNYLLDMQTKYPIDINQTNSQGETILCTLVKQKNIKDIKVFVNRLKPSLNNLDNNKSNLLQLACEHNLNELVEWCLETQSMTITKARGDRFSALDLTLIKQNQKILHKLWAKLSPKQSSTYINILKRRSEQRLLEFLETAGLYNSEDDKEEELKSSTDKPCEQETEQKPQVIAHTTENAEALVQSPEIEASLVCDEQTLYEAVQNLDHEYFRKLKHTSEHNRLLQEHAQPLLEAATRTQNYRLVYNILRIPMIASSAHFNNNQVLTIAAAQGTKNIVEALLRINSVAISLQSFEHPAKLTAAANGHTETVELLSEYIDANQEIQKTASQDLTDDDMTITTTSSESSRPNSTSLPMFYSPRPSSSVSSTISSNCTDKDSASPFDENLPQFITDPTPPKSEHVTIPKPKNKPIKNDDILEQAINDLNINAKPFEALPRCFRNPELFKTLQKLSTIFKKADIYGYIYGSAQYKVNPGDLDILLPCYNIVLSRKKINNLIEMLINHGAVVTSIDKLTGCYGYSYEGRHVIPLELLGTTIELVVYPKSITEHAYSLDFTRSARYLSVRSWNYVAVPGVYANIDITHNRIQTIVDAHASFLKDPRRIFRAVKQMVDEGDKLSKECEQAIHDIFYGRNNPFISHITIGKMYHRMEVFLQAERPKLYFEKLDKLGIFEKLYECFALHSDYSAAYYQSILEPYKRQFNFRREQEQMQLASQSQYTMYNFNYPTTKEVQVAHMQYGNNIL